MATESEGGVQLLQRNLTLLDLESQPLPSSSKTNFGLLDRIGPLDLIDPLDERGPLGAIGPLDVIDLPYVIHVPAQGLPLPTPPLRGGRDMLLLRCPRALVLHLLGVRGKHRRTLETCMIQCQRHIQA